MTRTLTLTFLCASAAVLIGGEIPGVGVWEPPAGHKQALIWPGTPPGARPITGPETFATNTTDLVAGQPWVHVDNVSQPTITRFAPQGENTGAAVVVFPGGGYWLLAIDLEGTEDLWLARLQRHHGRVAEVSCSGRRQAPEIGSVSGSRQKHCRMRKEPSAWFAPMRGSGTSIRTRSESLGFRLAGTLVAAVSTHFRQAFVPGRR